jgi:NADH dehydrogenase FAD-containing subunit
MKIVILGAGYGGVFAAANLCKHVGMEILLIDKSVITTNPFCGIRYKRTGGN